MKEWTNLWGASHRYVPGAGAMNALRSHRLNCSECRRNELCVKGKDMARKLREEIQAAKEKEK